MSLLLCLEGRDGLGHFDELSVEGGLGCGFVVSSGEDLESVVAEGVDGGAVEVLHFLEEAEFVALELEDRQRRFITGQKSGLLGEEHELEDAHGPDEVVEGLCEEERELALLVDSVDGDEGLHVELSHGGG